MRHAIDALRHAMRAPDDRTAGILYWYALSGALARVALLAGADAGKVPVAVGPGGWPELGDAPPSDRPLDALGGAFRAAIPTAAAASGATEQSLWAIATDSIASAALETGEPHRRAQEALAACGPAAPAARFETVPGRGTVVRRGSCCLLYLCPGSSRCLSCPRQTPQERMARLRGRA